MRGYGRDGLGSCLDRKIRIIATEERERKREVMDNHRERGESLFRVGAVT